LIAALEVEHIGTGIHFVQEDNGPAIGIAVARRREQQGLVMKPSRKTYAQEDLLSGRTVTASGISLVSSRPLGRA